MPHALTLALCAFLSVPELEEADSPLDALFTHAAAVWAAWRP